MSCWGYLKETSQLYPIFGTQGVPILSLIPIIPREQGAPLCYVILGNELSREILDQLAAKLFELWQPECIDLEMAREYITKGLPLKTTHFSGVGGDNLYQMPMAAALNIAIRAEYE